jgi:two-component system, sensor histidine kinase and response regulator
MQNSEDEFSDLRQRIKALETELAIEKLKNKQYENQASSAQEHLKETEKKLEQTGQNLSTSVHEKSQFIAKLTHELRTPLNGILGMTDLLLKTALNGEQRDQALVISESARSLLELINDFLDFSRIESGKAELEIIDFELIASVEAIADLLAEQSRQKGIELVSFVSPKLPAVLKGDPGSIRQVLLNLASNAVKFTQSGCVFMQATLLESLGADNLIVRFSVRDTGMGIESDNLERLFEPFTQASLSVKREFGGTGLGLTISRGLVNLMGGKLAVESTKGKGSHFWFDLPLKAVGGGLNGTATRELSGRVCLIISAFPPIAGVLDSYAAAWGMRVINTDSIDSALAVLGTIDQQKKAGAVIIDGDSVDAHRLFIEAEHRNLLSPKVRILLLTSNYNEDVESHMVAEGFAALLAKPVKYWSLYNTLEHILVKSLSPKLDRRLTVQIPKLAHADKVILVADDSPVNQKVALLQLKSLGLMARAVSSGEEALDQVATGDYALVLMDCQMPDMDGFQATKAIRKTEEGTNKRIPIIALTGSADAEGRAKCLDSGMDEVLIKPVAPNKLMEVIDRFLKGEKTEKQQRITQTILKPDASVVAATPLRDPVDFEELKKSCGVDVAHDIIVVYLSAAETLLGGLREARESRDAVALAALSHQLRGSSQAVGAQEMVTLSDKLSAHARKNSWIEAKETIESLIYSFSRLKKFTERVLAEDPDLLTK